jgi:hypothetical protein
MQRLDAASTVFTNPRSGVARRLSRHSPNPISGPPRLRFARKPRAGRIPVPRVGANCKWKRAGKEPRTRASESWDLWVARCRGLRAATEKLGESDQDRALAHAKAMVGTLAACQIVIECARQRMAHTMTEQIASLISCGGHPVPRLQRAVSVCQSGKVGPRVEEHQMFGDVLVPRAR